MTLGAIITEIERTVKKETYSYLFRDKGNRYADRMIDLYTASRDDLIRLILIQHERITALEAVVVEQRAVITTLEATVAQLTQRFGVRLVSLIATLHEEARLPMATIQWYLQTVHALSVSVGAIVGALRQVAQAGGPAVATIREEIRGSPVVYGDETGWREDGVNGYVWVFCTPVAQYFTRGSRGGAMVDAVLGRSARGCW